MLSYQHSYHAGCFADVMKHALLVRLLNYLTQKETPLLYLDTHSGRGRYDLKDSHALKTNEASVGIQPVWENRNKLSDLLSPYIKTIELLNSDNILRYYPGSAEIAIQILRQQDRLVFCELHPAEFEFLKQLPRRKHRVLLKKEDGLGNLNSFLPPLEKRGLVFIDPSYEVKTEYQTVVQAIKSAFKRSPTTTYCLWYPVIKNALPSQFVESLQVISSNKNHLRLEFYASQKTDIGMTGSGLWVINPPYTLAKEGEIILQELSKIICPERASYLVE